MTVRDFINKYPDATLDMMTPYGYVCLTPEKAKALLEGGDVSGHPGVPGASMPIEAEELLGQTVENVNKDNEGVLHVLTSNGPDTGKLEKEHAQVLAILEKLNPKLDAGYEAYRQAMVQRGAEIVFENAAEVHFNQQAYDELSGGGYPADMLEYLLRFEDPLEVAREQWQREENTDISDAFQHALWNFMDKRDAEADYALDEAYLPDEQEPGQQMG